MGRDDDRRGSADIRQLLDRRAASGSARVAYVEGSTGRSLTWSDVAAAVPSWEELGDRSGSGARVGLVASDPLVAARSFLAALATGVLLAPLDPAATSAELALAAERLGLAAIVTDGDLAALPDTVEGWPLDSSAPGPTVPATAAEAATTAGRCPPPAGGESAALLMASSGTTGEPKLIPLEAHQLLSTAEGVVAAHGLGARTVGYSPLPLFHINGLVVGVLANLVGGGRLVLERRFSASRFWRVAAEQSVTWCNLVPAILAVLGSSEPPAPGVTARIAFARSASAPLPAPVRHAFEAATGIGILETYGMTEVASQICANPLEPAARRPGTVGRPVDVELRVVDPDGAVVAAGTCGEVQLRGTRVVRRYWSPGTSASRPATGPDGWLATGDLGQLDAEGYLTLLGRVDDVINRGGEKVLPGEVEEVLVSHPDVAAVAVVGRPHPVTGAEPVAYVVARPGAAPELTERLERLAAERLSRWRRPAEVVLVDTLPTGPTGKVRRSALRATGTAATGAAGPPPRPEGAPDPPGSLLSGLLAVPRRSPKPRDRGLTMVIDGGQPTSYFTDAVRSAADHIDLVKFGWGTALVTPDIDTKIAVLRELGIRFYFGGTLFEKFVAQDRFDAFLGYVGSKGADTVEISNGTIALSNTAKAAYVRKCADRFTVLSEVGFKDSERSGRQSPSQWVDAIGEDLDAGATMVITEARESGSSGICRSNGELRVGLVEDILLSGLDPDRLLWEAPNKSLQTHFLTRIGPEVNLGNIAVDQVIGLETLRLGLRADTLLHVEQTLETERGAIGEHRGVPGA